MFGFIGYESTKTEEEEAELNLSQELVEEIDGLLELLESTNEEVPLFRSAAEEIDLEGRCRRLQLHLKNLGESPSEEMFEEDLCQFLPLFTDMRTFFRTIQDAKLAPTNCWERWLHKPHGKYARRLIRLNDRLNDRIADHVLCVNIHLPEKETRYGFPPKMEHMLLTRPSVQPQEEDVSSAEAARQKLLLRRSSTTSSAFTTSTASTVSVSSGASWSSNSTAGSTSTCINNHTLATRLPTQLSLGLDSSIRSVSSIHSRMSHLGLDASFASAFHQDDSHHHHKKIHWDFSPRVIRQDKWWGSSNSNASKCRKDRINLYIKTQVLRDMPQDTQVKELRIVLAQLEAGDTSPGVQAGKAAMMAIGTLGALMVSPFGYMGGFDGKEHVTQTPLEAAAVFTHYLIEFELVDGTIGTLENCVEDIYLYAGRSCRKEQHCVARVPLLPGCIGSPDSLDQPITLGDLIRFRNEQRKRPYKLWDNNCKHFCYSALTSGTLFPRASNYQEENLEVFFALCQGCYVQREEFYIFSESHCGGGGNAELARQIMTLWEQDGLDLSSTHHDESEDYDEVEDEEHQQEDLSKTEPEEGLAAVSHQKPVLPQLDEPQPQEPTLVAVEAC